MTLPHTQRIEGDPGLARFKERLALTRDQFGQPEGDWSDFQLDLLSILEDVVCEDIDPDKTLAAYTADIIGLFATEDPQ